MTRYLVPALAGALTLTACRQAVDPTLVRLNGRIEAAMVDLSPKVTGRVREVLVKEGDRVKAGDVLVRLDLGETGLTVARDKSAVAAAQARVRDLRRHELQEPFELVRVAPHRRSELRRIGVGRRLERPHVDLQPVAELLHSSQHAHRVALGEACVE